MDVMGFEYPALQKTVDDFIVPTHSCMKVMHALLVKEGVRSPVVEKIVGVLAQWPTTPPVVVLKDLEDFRAQYLTTCCVADVRANVSASDALSTKRLVGIAEMAGILGRTKNWIYQRTRLNKIPYKKVGKYVMFYPEEVLSSLKINNERTQ